MTKLFLKRSDSGFLTWYKATLSSLHLSKAGLKLVSCQSTNCVSFPSLCEAHSFHRADFQINIFSSLKIFLKTFSSVKLGAHLELVKLMLEMNNIKISSFHKYMPGSSGCLLLISRHSGPFSYAAAVQKAVKSHFFPPLILENI